MAKNRYGAGINFQATGAESTTKSIKQVGSAFVVTRAHTREYVNANQKAIVSMRTTTGGARVLTATVSNLSGSLRSSAASMAVSEGAGRALGRTMVETANKFLHFGMSILGTIPKATKAVIGIAQVFEMARVQMRAVFGGIEEGDKAFAKALLTAEITSLKTRTVLTQTAKLKRLGVDPLKSYSIALQDTDGVIRKRMIPAMQLINDLVVGSGQTQQNVTLNLAKAVMGNIRNFRALFDGLETPYLEMFKKAKSAQDRFDIIMKVIDEARFAGITAVAQHTFDFISKNIVDVIENLLGLLGENLLRGLRPFMINLFQFLQALKENQNFMTEMGRIFKQFGDVLAWIGINLLKAASVFRDFLAAHPGILKLIVAFIAMSGSIITLIGVMAMIGGIFVIFAKIIVPAIVMSLTVLLKTVIALAVPFLALAALAGIVFAAWEHNLGGFREFVLDIMVALEGLWVVIKNWTNSTSHMSVELSEKLKERGLFFWVVQIGGAIGATLDLVGRGVRVVWDILRNGFKEFRPFFSELHGLFMAMGTFFSSTLVALFGEDVIAGNVSGVKRELSGIMFVLVPIINALTYISNLFASIFKWASGLFTKSGGVVFAQILSGIWNILSAVFGVLSKIGTAVFPIVLEIGKELYLIFVQIYETLKPIVMLILEQASSIWKGVSAAMGLKSGVGGIGEAIVSVIKFMANVVYLAVYLIRVIITIIAKIVSFAYWILQVTQYLWVMQQIWKAIGFVIGLIINGISWIINGLKSIVGIVSGGKNKLDIPDSLAAKKSAVTPVSAQTTTPISPATPSTILPATPTIALPSSLSPVTPTTPTTATPTNITALDSTIGQNSTHVEENTVVLQNAMLVMDTMTQAMVSLERAISDKTDDTYRRER